MNPESLGDRPAALVGLESLEGFLPLMGVELGYAA
jgi:hypothetical protein